MRWEALFSDLDSRMQALERLSVHSEVREKTRVETAQITLVDRLLGSVGNALEVTLMNGEELSGTLTSAYVQWILISGVRAESVVATSAVAIVTGLSATIGPPPGSAAKRLGLSHVLRTFARDRSEVSLSLIHGDITGVCDRVGADYVEVTRHAPGEPRRGRRQVTVAHEVICAVHSRGNYAEAI